MTTLFNNPPATLASSFMDRTFDTLLGLKRLTLSEDGADWDWHFQVPAWAWALIVIGALGAALWSYSRLIGKPWPRVMLAVTRAALIVVIAMLLAGPMVVVRDELDEPDWLLVLVDRSESMTIADVPKDGSDDPNARIARDAQLRKGLAQYPELFTDKQLGRDNRRILWLGFHGGTYEIEGADDPETAATGVALPPAQGQSTAVATAIEQALQRAAGRPITGVVLFTDGRTHEATGADLVRMLKGVSVFPVPLGSPITPMNLKVERVEAPARAFVNDIVPVTVYLDQYPADSGVDPDDVRVRVVDAQTGKVLAERAADPEGLDKPIRLITRSAAAGATTMRVEVEYTKPIDQPDAPDELLTEDNVGQVVVEFVDRPLRVLYVEGRPRWEYRFLKHILMREKTIRSSILLARGDGTFVQEGDVETPLPRTVDEFDPFDVIIVGDLPARVFNDQQVRLISDHVTARGAGVLWIGGESAMPVSYDGTPLAKLLPMRHPAEVTALDLTTGAVDLQPTPSAGDLNVLRLRRRGEGEDGRWPKQLPALQWAQDVGKLKDLAEPLAVTTLADDRTLPIVVRLRSGAGQSVYVATDDTFRWRLGTGNLYVQQFWVQLIQMLGKSRVALAGDRAAIDVSHRRIEIEQSLVVTVHINDPLLIERDLPRIEVGVFKRSSDGATTGRPSETLELLPVQRPEGEDAPRRQTFQTTWRPSDSGKFDLRILTPALANLDLERTVTVTRPDDELRDPATDHPRLQALADASGGQVVPLDELDQLTSLIKNNARRTANDSREAVWDSPLALIIVIVLLTAEWIGRKLIRLV